MDQSLPLGRENRQKYNFLESECRLSIAPAAPSWMDETAADLRSAVVTRHAVDTIQASGSRVRPEDFPLDIIQTVRLTV
jgi:hypothetical protein